MKRKVSILLILMLVMSLFTGCQNADNNQGLENGNKDIVTEKDENSTQEDSILNDEDMFTKRDYKTEYDESDVITINLNGTSATASSDSVKISGTTITITEEKTHIISGILTDGMIIVDADESAKLQLVFDGAHITSQNSAALYILEADKVFVTLAEGSKNTLANGGEFTAIDDNNIDGAIFSKQDLTLNGSGELVVDSPAGHGIVCKDDLVFTGGSYVVNAASHGLDVNDSVRIAEASLTIESGEDAIHAEDSDEDTDGFIYISSGNIAINAGDDGIHAEDSLTIKFGKIDIFESCEGLEAFQMDIQGGDIRIVASDDGLNASGGTEESDTTEAQEFVPEMNGERPEMPQMDGKMPEMNGERPERGERPEMSGERPEMNGERPQMGGGAPGGFAGFGGASSSNSNGSIKISGGILYINASGDGIDANGSLEITGGHVTVVGPTHGDTAILDYDKTGVIIGGTFIGTGASGGMAQSFSDSEQGVIAVSVGNQSAGTEIILKDSNGNTLIKHSPELDFSAIILSSSDIIKGETYIITIGSQSGEVEAN